MNYNHNKCVKKIGNRSNKAKNVGNELYYIGTILVL